MAWASWQYKKMNLLGGAGGVGGGGKGGGIWAAHRPSLIWKGYVWHEKPEVKVVFPSQVEAFWLWTSRWLKWGVVRRYSCRAKFVIRMNLELSRYDHMTLIWQPGSRAWQAISVTQQLFDCTTIDHWRRRSTTTTIKRRTSKKRTLICCLDMLVLWIQISFDDHSGKATQFQDFISHRFKIGSHSDICEPISFKLGLMTVTFSINTLVPVSWIFTCMKGH